MAGDITFGIRLRADGREFVGEIQASARAIDQLGAQAAGASHGADRLAGAMQRAGHYAAGLIGINYGTALVRQAVTTADAWTRVESRLRLVTGSSLAAASAQQQLYAIAQQTRQGFTDLADVYAQVARASADSGRSQARLLGITQTLSQAITLSGASAEAARAALLQLSQGLASGTLRGEELNSVMEQTPRLAQAVAEGLGVGVGQLRKLAEQGQLTTDAILGALENSAGSVEAEFAQLTPTVGEAFTTLSNAGGRFIDVINDISGATERLAGFVNDAAGTLDRFSGELDDAAAAGLTFWQALKGIGLSNPFASHGEEIRRITAEIDGLNKKLEDSTYRRSHAGFRDRVAELEKLLDYHRRRQKAEADALISGQNLDANDRRLARSAAALVSGNTRLTQSTTAGAAARKEAAKAAEALARSLSGWFDERRKGLATIDDEIEAERAAREAMGKSRAEVLEMEAAKLDLAAASKEVEAANLAEAAIFAGPLADAYRQAARDAEEAAAKQRELAAEKRATAGAVRTEEGEAAEKKLADKAIAEQRRAAEASGAFWTRVYDDVGRGLTDSIFEGGQDGWELLKRSIESTFIRAYVQPIVTQGVAGIGQTFGFGPGSAASAGGQVFGGASVSDLGYLNNVAGLGVGNAAGTAYANATGTGLDGLLSTNGAYGTAQAGSATYTGAGSFGNVAGGIGGGYYFGQQLTGNAVGGAAVLRVGDA